MPIKKITCPFCKKTYEVVSKSKMQRSNPQNAYFHGVVLPILARHTGNTQEEMKELLKGMFLKKLIHIKDKQGEEIEIIIVMSTASITTSEFKEFIEKIQRWASSFLGCNIPSPNECT